MSEVKLNGTFISEKIAKIRWIPEQFTSPENFLTGSWDFDVNNIRVWKYKQNEYADDEVELVPTCTAKLPINGDVSGMEMVGFDDFVVGSSDGSISLININRRLTNDNITESYCLNNLHSFGPDNSAPCTGLSVFETNASTIGEDGCLNIVSLHGKSIIRAFKNASSCSPTCVSFINTREIVIGNRMGFLKMFDIRQEDEKPTITFLTSCSDDKVSNAVSAIAYHPTQKHIIIVGTEEGSITVWDLRQLSYPASYLAAHDSSITEINFHQSDPTKLFTASEGGELFQWSHSSPSPMESQMQINETDAGNPWLSGERTKHRINGIPLITGIRKSINSFDATGSKLVTCCDNEAIYLIENVH